MRKFQILFIGLIIIALLVFWLRYQIYAPVSSDSQERLFSIEKGQGLWQIAANLEKQNFIRDDIYFAVYVYLQGKEKQLKAGDYLLSGTMTIPEIADKIAQGKTDEIKITIIEGWNISQIAQYLEEVDFSKKEEFLAAAQELEGYLFPDTYKIAKNKSPADLIEMMLNNFDKKMTPELKAEIEAQNKTVFEILTMASLIEKEVGQTGDRRLVAGILWKRIEAGIPLQVDASITYITGKKSTKVSLEDTKIDSPYNTYKYQGLPKGPIANPSLDSIKAAIYPEPSPYWYYLSTPEGKTIFSQTLAEHNLAKAKYLPR